MDEEKCTGCGHCAIGCPWDAKWDTRSLVNEAVENGAQLITGCKALKLEITDGIVTGVETRHHGIKKIYRADIVVVCAGGIGTPPILNASGIPTQNTLFVDPVLCVAGPLDDIRQDQQVLMPFISQQEGYILSPYMDYLSFLFNHKWNYPIQGLASIMIKMADEEVGSVDANKVYKHMTYKDTALMGKAVTLSREILRRIGVPDEKQFLGTLNAGHPGGMLPLTHKEKDSLHHDILLENLYVADATILPKAMGNPPILTIMALSLKISQQIQSQFL